MRARRRWHGRSLCCPLLQDQVGIGTTHTKRADAGSTWRGHTPFIRAWLPRLVGRRKIQPGAVGRDLRVQLGEVDVAGQGAVFHGQQHLGHTGDAGGGLQVSDVRLHRPYRARHRRTTRQLRVIGQEAGGLQNAVDLDRIAERGARAVRLEIVEHAQVEPGLPVRRDQQFCLRVRIGHGHTAGVASMILRAAANHAVNLVAVAQGQTQRLEKQRADAFGPHVAVGGAIKRLARPVR